MKGSSSQKQQQWGPDNISSNKDMSEGEWNKENKQLLLAVPTLLHHPSHKLSKSTLPTLPPLFIALTASIYLLLLLVFFFLLCARVYGPNYHSRTRGSYKLMCLWLLGASWTRSATFYICRRVHFTYVNVTTLHIISDYAGASGSRVPNYNKW